MKNCQITQPAEMEEAVLLEQMDISKLIAKEQIVNQSRIELAWQKMQMQEYRQAVKDASYTVVSVNNDGMIETKSQNAFVNLPKRPITNFCFDIMVKLVSADGDEGFFGLQIAINGKAVQIFLDAEKMGRPDYFMKKLTAVGGKILVDKERDRRNILTGLWVELLGNCKEVLTVPTRIGWMADPDKGYRLVKEGALLWQDIIRRAK